MHKIHGVQDENRDLIFIKWVKYGTFTAHYSERDRSWPQFITLKLTVCVSVFVFTGFLLCHPSPPGRLQQELLLLV